ncbi:uncharacterized protein LOC123196234 isoform X5 [Mangifera indica]|uniref:uncharacterized protein LOC123196234 isoform X5 n=1 Tax=Mangifera indica TaxID=29780 RepID=UPI001CFC362E|nr:uncharacterized protein LOC123196234 isoform X5 [Mangifera indica]
MEAMSVGSDPRLYSLIKISERIKRLQDLLQWYKNNFTPENAGILHDSKAYLQSLQRQITGGATVSSDVNGTYLQCGQVLIDHNEIVKAD